MRWLIFTLVALGIAIIAAFTIQNSGRTVDLSLDLWFAAWKLSKPASASALVWGSFLTGGGLVAGWALLRQRGLSRRIRQLEQQIALSGGSSGGDWRG